MTSSVQQNQSLVSYLASLPESERKTIIQKLSLEQQRVFRWDWDSWARPSQKIPGSDGALSQRKDWIHWFPRAGRGWGKTRVGAETVRKWGENSKEKINIIGPTSRDVRRVMIDGPSGLMSCYPPFRRPHYEPSKYLITFPSGATAETFSADEPERIRGPQCTKYWADEVCAWRFLEDSWDNLMFGFRLGDDLRGIITSTPKVSKWLREMMQDPDVLVTVHSTYENATHLAKVFLKNVVKKYEGTRLGRQELLAEILDDLPGALWTRAMIENHRARLNQVPRENIIRIVVAIDPAVSAGEDSADTGIVVAGLTRNGHVLVLDDKTCHESPGTWAKIAISAFETHGADRIIGEINNGGDLVEANLRACNPNIPFRQVRASRGKAVRAEPVAALYEQGRVHHVGTFPQLEDQMALFVPGAEVGRLDRMDALVWAITELLIDPEVMTMRVTLPHVLQISPY